MGKPPRLKAKYDQICMCCGGLIKGTLKHGDKADYIVPNKNKWSHYECHMQAVEEAKEKHVDKQLMLFK